MVVWLFKNKILPYGIGNGLILKHQWWLRVRSNFSITCCASVISLIERLALMQLFRYYYNYDRTGIETGVYSLSTITI